MASSGSWRWRRGRHPFWRFAAPWFAGLSAHSRGGHSSKQPNNRSVSPFRRWTPRPRLLTDLATLTLTAPTSRLLDTPAPSPTPLAPGVWRWPSCCSRLDPAVPGCAAAAIRHGCRRCWTPCATSPAAMRSPGWLTGAASRWRCARSTAWPAPASRRPAGPDIDHSRAVNDTSRPPAATTW